MVKATGGWTRFCAGLAATVAAMPCAAQQAGEGVTAPYTIEVAPAAARVVVGQQLPVLVQVAYDVDWHQQHGIPLLAQPLDLPFALQSDWFGSDATWGIEFVDHADGPRAAVGERVVRWRPLAEQVRAGRRWRAYAAEFVATPRTAAAAAQSIVLRYAHASGFREDFLSGRQPIDRQDGRLVAPAPALTVAELPTPGQPPDFGGAVGEFALRAELRQRTGEVGRELDVDLVVTGRGELSGFRAPSPPNLPGWYVVGMREQPRPGARVFAYQVIPLRDGDLLLPPFELVVFSPSAWAYTTLRSEPQTVAVAPARQLELLPAPVRQKIAADEQERAAASAVPAWYWLVLIVAGGCTLLGALRTRQRAARRKRAQAARDAFCLTLDGEPSRLLQCFEVLVAACRGGGPLGEADWAACDDLTRELRSRLQDAAYGGPRPEAAELRAFAQRLVADLR